ncbi:MAG: hypothetical protein AAGK14_08645 [Verrucomicrobiota bacterium]
MRLSQSLETEQTKREQRGLDYCLFRLNLIQSLYFLIPVAFLLIFALIPASLSLSDWVKYAFAGIMAVHAVGGLIFMSVYQRGLTRFRIEFPQLKDAETLYWESFVIRPVRILVTTREIRRYSASSWFICTVVKDECRIHLKDVISIRSTWYTGPWAVVVRYRTSFGEQSTVLIPRRMKPFWKALNHDGVLRASGRWEGAA